MTAEHEDLVEKGRESWRNARRPEDAVEGDSEPLRALSAAVTTELLRRLGAFDQPNGVVDAQRLLPLAPADSSAVATVARWLALAEGRGLVEREGTAYRARALANAPDIELHMAAVKRVHPGMEPVIDFLERCTRHGVDVLQGVKSAFDLYLPDGSRDLVDFLYARSRSAQVANGSVAALVVHAFRGHAASPLPYRILEVGAGTGGTTVPLVTTLAEQGGDASSVRYEYSDAARYFAPKVKKRLASAPFVTYRVFDVERAAVEQGLEPGSYDLVVAANVLHATRDLPAVLAGLRELLRPGGHLIVWELTEPKSWFEFSFALLDGWHRHRDALRAGHPLLDARRWCKALCDAGFASAAAIPESEDVLGQTILVARAAKDDSR